MVSLDPLVVLYDGRRTAADNWHERTGLARGALGGELVADAGVGVLGSPHSDGALRYATQVTLPDGTVRLLRGDGPPRRRPRPRGHRRRALMTRRR